MTLFFLIISNSLFFCLFSTVDIIPNDNKVTLKGITFLPTKGSLSGSNVTGLLRGRVSTQINSVFFLYILPREF